MSLLLVTPELVQPTSIEDPPDLDTVRHAELRQLLEAQLKVLLYLDSSLRESIAFAADEREYDRLFPVTPPLVPGNFVTVLSIPSEIRYAEITFGQGIVALANPNTNTITFAELFEGTVTATQAAGNALPMLAYVTGGDPPIVFRTHLSGAGTLTVYVNISGASTAIHVWVRVRALRYRPLGIEKYHQR